jgi:hypothetical protein
VTHVGKCDITTQSTHAAITHKENNPMSKKQIIMPNGLKVKSTRGNGAWIREEIAIMQGCKSFTPDKTMNKGPVSLGPIGNSVARDTI